MIQAQPPARNVVSAFSLMPSPSLEVLSRLSTEDPPINRASRERPDLCLHAEGLDRYVASRDSLLIDGGVSRRAPHTLEMDDTEESRAAGPARSLPLVNRGARAWGARPRGRRPGSWLRGV